MNLFLDIARLTPNVALGGTATQSSTHIHTNFEASPFVASYAIDGNFDTNLVPHSGAFSATNPAPPVWWQVDLQEVYEITKVAITGREEESSKHSITI